MFRPCIRNLIITFVVGLLITGCSKDYLTVVLQYPLKSEVRTAAREHNLAEARRVLEQGRRIRSTSRYGARAYEDAFALLLLALSVRDSVEWDKLLVDPSNPFDVQSLAIASMTGEGFVLGFLKDLLPTLGANKGRALGYIRYGDDFWKINGKLVTLLSDDSPTVRFMVASDLIRVDYVRACPALLKVIMYDADIETRRNVAHLLSTGNIKVPFLIPELEEIAKAETDSQVKYSLTTTIKSWRDYESYIKEQVRSVISHGVATVPVIVAQQASDQVEPEVKDGKPKDQQ